MQTDFSAVLGWSVQPASASPAAYAIPAPRLPPAGLAPVFADFLAWLADQLHAPVDDAGVLDALKRYCREKRVRVSRADGEALAHVAARNALGYGALDYLLGDDSLEEIAVTGVGEPVRVYHREKGWLETNARIASRAFGVALVNKMARALGRRLTFQQPRLNAVLPNGVRVHASTAPLATRGVEVTLRKFRATPFSLPELVRNGTLSADLAAFLWLALSAGSSLVACGTTGSGKTTTLGALFSLVPLSERVVVTEDSPELRLPHAHVVNLVASEENGVPLRSLVADTLRMRPDRLVVGELRAETEVRAFMDALLSGQARGAYATFHAGSARECLARFTALGARPADLPSLDLVLVQQRLLQRENGKWLECRRATELAEVGADGSPRHLFSNGRALPALSESRVLERAALAHRASARDALAGLSRRARVLADLPPSLSPAGVAQRLDAFA